MGIALWAACGVVSFLLARVVPVAKKRPRLGELAASILVALILGLIATAMDFGGWSEPDWRAGLFAFFGSFAALGILRLPGYPVAR